MSGYPYLAKRRISALSGTLVAAIGDKDTEQEIGATAIPVLDAVIKAVKDELGDDPVVIAIRDVISPEAIEWGEPPRAIDLLHIVEQLDAVIGDPPRRPIRGYTAADARLPR